jgi:hypothetical protein
VLNNYIQIITIIDLSGVRVIERDGLDSFKMLSRRVRFIQEKDLGRIPIDRIKGNEKS